MFLQFSWKVGKSVFSPILLTEKLMQAAHSRNKNRETWSQISFQYRRSVRLLLLGETDFVAFVGCLCKRIQGYPSSCSQVLWAQGIFQLGKLGDLKNTQIQITIPVFDLHGNFVASRQNIQAESTPRKSTSVFSTVLFHEIGMSFSCL